MRSLHGLNIEQCVCCDVCLQSTLHQPIAVELHKSLQSLLFSLIVINLQKKCINLNDKFCDNIEKIIEIQRILCQKGIVAENMFFF